MYLYSRTMVIGMTKPKPKLLLKYCKQGVCKNYGNQGSNNQGPPLT